MNERLYVVSVDILVRATSPEFANESVRDVLCQEVHKPEAAIRGTFYVSEPAAYEGRDT